MSQELKEHQYYEPKVLEDALIQKMPIFVKDNGHMMLPPESKIYLSGFWSRLDFKGS
jgi:hypothetical protein